METSGPLSHDIKLNGELEARVDILISESDLAIHALMHKIHDLDTINGETNNETI